MVNVLLDLDGTLTDPCEGITACIEHALLALGRSSPPRNMLARHIGPPLQQAFAELLGSRDEAIISEAVSAYRERFTKIGLYENQLYPGIPEALSFLVESEVKIFLATSKPHLFADRMLDHFGLQKHFSGVYGSELDGTRTDKAELIAHILRNESLTARETLMVGDRKHDIIGALKNDVFPVGVLWGYGSRDELVDAGAAVILGRPDELGGLLHRTTLMQTFGNRRVKQ